MNVAKTAQLSPGECYTCGRTEGPFVDTLREEIRGRVYVCWMCVRTMGELVGVRREVDAAKDEGVREVERLTRLLERETEDHEALRKAVTLTLKQGAVAKSGQIQLRRRPIAQRS